MLRLFRRAVRHASRPLRFLIFSQAVISSISSFPPLSYFLFRFSFFSSIRQPKFPQHAAPSSSAFFFAGRQLRRLMPPITFRRRRARCCKAQRRSVAAACSLTGKAAPASIIFREEV